MLLRKDRGKIVRSHSPGFHPDAHLSVERGASRRLAKPENGSKSS